MALGPLTAADDDDTSGALDVSFDPATSGGYNLDQTDDLSADYPGASSIAAGYRAAVERLKAQRAGLSGDEKLGALLLGFGQPVRRGGNWRDSVSNAAQSLMANTLAAKKDDRAREALIAKYTAEAGPKAATGQAALDRANKPADLVKDGQQRTRLGYARNIFPGLTDKELVEGNYLYDPKVEKLLLRLYGARSAAAVGEEVDDEDVAPVTPAEAPALDVFLVEARKANPGVSDDDLTAYYHKKYGGQ